MKPVFLFEVHFGFLYRCYYSSISRVGWKEIRDKSQFVAESDLDAIAAAKRRAEWMLEGYRKHGDYPEIKLGSVKISYQSIQEVLPDGRIESGGFPNFFEWKCDKGVSYEEQVIIYKREHKIPLDK